jgi:hypothetical protein
MSVSSNLLCSFELLKPLDSSALKSHIKRGRNARQNMLNSPVCNVDHWLGEIETNILCSRHRSQRKASKSSRRWHIPPEMENTVQAILCQLQLPLDNRLSFFTIRPASLAVRGPDGYVKPGNRF